MESDIKEKEQLAYNQISIKDLETEEWTTYTIKKVTWVRDSILNEQYLNADHVTVNDREVWIARLHEATGLEDTALRNMDRRIFETLAAKWVQINGVDNTAFLEIYKKEGKD